LNPAVADRTAFIRANTAVMAPPLVPEVRLHLAHEAVPIWQKTEDELGEIGLPPPFWAFAWAGGQALARHLLDHPEIVRDRRVIDLASGSGLVGIAAMKAGAVHVLAADIDGFAVAAIALNAAGNGVALDITADDLLTADPPDCDVILVGDLFYEKSLAERVYAWLRRADARGVTVLIGDPGRSYLPREKLEKLAEYAVPVTRDLEDAEIKRTAVWRLAPNC
jgi:predicted nicotinamide N-methyase